jgi:1-acyl-sn-glycerol-3-phosphate acyltransferase
MQTSLIAYLPITQKLARAILNLAGWRVDTIYPSEKKYVMVGAHHTSNWDLPVALLFSMATGIKFNFIGKDEAFRWPFGGFMRWLGGIPVNRRARTHFVNQIAEEFRARENLIIVITPEGTRKKTEYWKTGFYYIALAANVPVALGYLDYPRKRVGIGKMITLVGDLEADLAVIREFYADKMGKYPQDHGEIRIRPTESENRRQ